MKTLVRPPGPRSAPHSAQACSQYLRQGLLVLCGDVRRRHHCHAAADLLCRRGDARRCDDPFRAAALPPLTLLESGAIALAPLARRRAKTEIYRTMKI